MNAIEKGQVILSAAEVYDQFFVPALFEQWGKPMINAVNLKAGQSVIDVACGTGALTLKAAARVGPAGRVVGLDVNSGMLNVAKQKSSLIHWETAAAEHLPFEDGQFDAVISQFGLMFFDDRLKALSEMVRVLKPGGRFAVAVWGKLENTPGYAAVANLLAKLFGEDIAAGITSPYCLGDKSLLAQLFNRLPVNDLQITTVMRQAHFESIDKWMYTDIKGWTLADSIDDFQFEQLLAHAKISLKQFTNEAGQVYFDAPAHLITGQKPI